jgi:carbonic anhydrase
VKTLRELFENNRAWAARTLDTDPDFFKRLTAQQTPRYLWIGCADSRVPANEIVGLPPGELFVHRNVANLVMHTDLNCLSVLQYAIDVLHVRDVIVCGHYGCGGVRAALQRARLGLIDNWLRALRDTDEQHRAIVDAATDRADCLCELNVIEQVRNVANTTVLQDAWLRGQPVAVHVWVYALHDGLLRDLGFMADSRDAVERGYQDGLNAVARQSASADRRSPVVAR